MKTRLRIFAESQPATPLEILSDRHEIAERLDQYDIHIEHWEAATPLFPDATEAEVLEAYGADVFRLQIERDYKHVDVLRVQAGDPALDQLRERLQGEHSHADDEVRFIVEGSAVYFLHIGTEVLELCCSAGDLLAVPRDVKHWFDPGEVPYLTMIRLFSEAPGWAAQFTGNPLVDQFAPFCGAGAPLSQASV